MNDLPEELGNELTLDKKSLLKIFVLHYWFEK